MVPLCPVWFLPWYPTKPGSKSKPTRNQNQYLIPVWVNTETNTKTSPKPESISKPRFEIESSNSIPILKSKPTSFAYPCSVGLPLLMCFCWLVVHWRLTALALPRWPWRPEARLWPSCRQSYFGAGRSSLDTWPEKTRSSSKKICSLLDCHTFSRLYFLCPEWVSTL